MWAIGLVYLASGLMASSLPFDPGQQPLGCQKHLLSLQQADRHRATLLGLAYGDVLGALTEDYTPLQVTEVFGSHLDPSAELPLDRIYHIRGEANYLRTRPPGATTDDTQQAMALQLLLLTHPDWEPMGLNAWAKLIPTGFDQQAWRGFGKTFVAAADKIRSGASWSQSGSPSQSLGAPMRVAALAALTASSRKVVQRMVLTSSLVTHASLITAAVSFAVYQSTWALLQDLPPDQIRAQLPDEVAIVEDQIDGFDTDWKLDRSGLHVVSTALRELFAGDFPNELQAISDRVLQATKEHQRPDRPAHPNSAVAVIGGLHAIALGLRDAVEPLQTLQYAALLGDDADSIAAMVGAMLGARQGTAWIPLEQLQDRARLERYADALITGEVPETIEAFLAHEAEITHQEKAFQEKLRAELSARAPQGEAP